METKIVGLCKRNIYKAGTLYCLQVKLMFENGDIIGLLMQILWVAFIFGFMFFGQRIQMTQISALLERNLLFFKGIRNKSFETAVRHIEKVGKGKNVKRKIKEFFLEYVTIIPTNLDPTDIVDKIEHIFDVREYHWEEKVKDLAPKANAVQRKNIEDVLQGVYVVNVYYKMARHFFLLAKKTKSYMFMVQAQMLMPILMGEAKTFQKAIDAFICGSPIGDGIGAYVAARMMEGHRAKKIAKETVRAIVPFKGRTLHIVKARGPHGTCGKPEVAIRKVVEKHQSSTCMIIMIDAGLMVEGDRRGEIVVGSGAAIGGFGNERFRIEETATKYKIPLYCWIIKESLKDAITPMRKEIIDSTDLVIKEIEEFILKETKKGDQILIAGIGNTMGVK